jgi:hypothetical protein
MSSSKDSTTVSFQKKDLVRIICSGRCSLQFCRTLSIFDLASERVPFHAEVSAEASVHPEMKAE